MKSSCADTPTNKDSFKIQAYIDALSDYIIECVTPMTIALQGDWGTGKTSIMEMVKDKLGDEVISVDFNTWKYSQFNMEKQLPILLIDELVTQITSTGRSNKKEDVATRWNALLKKGQEVSGKIVKQVINVVVGNATGGSAQIDWKEFQKSNLDILLNLKDHLKEAIDIKLKEDRKEKIVIYIDDLDRLQPERAIEVLEVMKLFLDCEHCVFVLAVDYEVIIQGIRKKYGEEMSKEKGRNFFDKMIQLPFKMPIERYEIKNYFAELMGWKGCDTELDVVENVQTISYKESLEDSSDMINDYVGIIENTIGRNPRAIKRIVNYYSILDRVAAATGSYRVEDSKANKKKKKVLFCLLCLQISYERLYAYIIDYKYEPEQLFSSLSDEDSWQKVYSEITENLEESRTKQKLNKAKDYFVQCVQELVDEAGYMALKDILDYSSITATGDASKQKNREYKKYFLRLKSDTKLLHICFYENGNVYRGLTAMTYVLLTHFLMKNDVKEINVRTNRLQLTPIMNIEKREEFVLDKDGVQYAIEYSGKREEDFMDKLIDDLGLSRYVTRNEEKLDSIEIIESVNREWIERAKEVKRNKLAILTEVNL